jgi:hypothetical protein
MHTFLGFKNPILYFAFFVFAAVAPCKAQLVGTYTVPGTFPGTFPSIASAISSLNQFGVVGPVTVYISAGYTETAIPGGYKLQSIIGSSSSNTILFQKLGVGANPTVYSYTNGVGTSTSNIQDGMWSFIGSDYVTVD